MIAWFKTNWKPLAHTGVSVACYLLYKFAPQMLPERELLIDLAIAWGIYGATLVPSFAKLPDGGGT